MSAARNTACDWPDTLRSAEHFNLVHCAASVTVPALLQCILMYSDFSMPLLWHACQKHCLQAVNKLRI